MVVLVVGGPPGPPGLGTVVVVFVSVWVAGAGDDGVLTVTLGGDGLV